MDRIRARLTGAFSGLIRRSDLLLAGVLVALAMPGPGWWPLVLPGLALLYRRAARPDAATPFVDGWLFGMASFATSLSWIAYVVHVYGHAPRSVAWIPWLLLAAYCALWPALGHAFAVRFASLRHRPWVWALALASTEEIRGHLLTGFPWNPWALPLTAEPWLLRPAGVLGVTGLGFLLALLAAGSWEALRGARKRGLALLAVALFAWGGLAAVFEPRAGDPDARLLRFALIQGNIEQDQKWSPEMRRVTVHAYEDLSRRALAHAPETELVVWPETSAPFYFQQGGPLREWVQRIPADLGVHLLFGSPAYRMVDGGDPELFNRAWLLGPDGREIDRYDKVHLVPFGEYVPLPRLLFFIDKLVEGLGSFARGETRIPLLAGDLPLAVLICYEAIFPYEVREFVARGGRVFVHITNDAWFGDTAAPHQHLALAQLRSVETGLPLIRAANTGISGWVDADGVVGRTTALFRRAWVTGEVRLGQPRPFVVLAPFWQVWWLGLGVAGLALAGRQWWLRRRRHSKVGPKPERGPESHGHDSDPTAN